jgi:hypothetical protein
MGVRTILESDVLQISSEVTAFNALVSAFKRHNLALGPVKLFSHKNKQRLPVDIMDDSTAQDKVEHPWTYDEFLHLEVYAPASILTLPGATVLRTSCQFEIFTSVTLMSVDTVVRTAASHQKDHLLFVL